MPGSILIGSGIFFWGIEGIAKLPKSNCRSLQLRYPILMVLQPAIAIIEYIIDVVRIFLKKL